MVAGEIVREGTFFTFRTMCPRCGKPAEVKGLRRRALEMWQKGAHIQDMFPDLSSAEREILMSGLHDECFDAWYPDLDEEYDDETF